MPSNSSLGKHLTDVEKTSITHGDFWIPEEEREKYKKGIAALNREGIPFTVAGAYAIHAYTGITRKTKDLDLVVEPRYLVSAIAALRREGFRTRLEQHHWLAKATMGEHFLDIIYGMGNGIALVDEDWYRHSEPAILAAHPVRVAPVEELIWNRLFINERHRMDMADISHLILCRGSQIDWKRLMDRTGEHWPLLLAHLHLFTYIYPEAESYLPSELLDEMLSRMNLERARERKGGPRSRGTLLSRFSFAIDINEWGFQDARGEAVRAQGMLPVIQEITLADVWDEMSDWVETYRKSLLSGESPSMLPMGEDVESEDERDGVIHG